MIPQPSWQELYQAAFLESRPQDLRRRIDAAEKAIRDQIAALQPSDPMAVQECLALEDALRGLRSLERSEFSCSGRPATPREVSA